MKEQVHTTKKMCSLIVALAISFGAFAAQLSGSYTINPSSPATTSNFQNFASAIAYLTDGSTRSDGGPSNSAPFGVSGPVTFIVSAGTYTEQVSLTGTIPGTSPVNTITFDGVDAATRILTGAYNGSTFAVVGQSYVTIKNLRVENLFAGACAGIALVGNTTNSAGSGCTIKKCSVYIPNTGTTGSYGINVTGTVTGLSETNQWTDSVTIDSNYIFGAYYGIQISTGPNGNAAHNRSHRIRYNTLDQTYYYGIRLYYIYNAVDVSYNTIKMSLANQSSYGIYSINNLNATAGTHSQFIGNNVVAGYSALYFSSFTSPLGDSIPIFNNVFMTFGTSAYVAAYLYASAASGNALHVFHNTIVATGPTATYGMYYYNGAATGTSYFKNNIFSCAGSGNPAYFSTNPSGNVVNYNNYSNSVGTTLLYRGSTYTAATYRTVTAGGDSSYNVKPDFTGSYDAHLKSICQPQSILNLSALVPKDIEGNVRSATPFVGAYEKALNANDVGVEAYIGPVAPIIPGGAADVVVRIKNYGTTTLTSLNIAYSLNGGTPMVMPWSGSLASCDTVTVTFTGGSQILLNAANHIKVYTSDPNVSADGNRLNDTVKVDYYEPLNGNYTIGGSTADFTTIQDAATALKSGVSGPVIFTINPGSYNEKVVIPGPVAGASQVNNIVFDGVDASSRILTSNASATATLLINKASFVTIKNLTVINTGFAPVSGIALVGSTANNAGVGFTVKHCNISMPNISNSIPMTYGILVTGDATGAAEANQWTDSVTIDSNTINKAYIGISIFSSAVNATYNHEHKIRRNTVLNAYNTGIKVNYVGNQVDVSYNTVIMDSIYTGSNGIYINYNQYGSAGTGTRVIGNKVYAGNAGLYYYYATCSATNPVLIYNNMLTTFGTSYAAYIYTGATGGIVAQIYHNSLTTLGSASYGLYYYNSTGSPTATMIKNNIFHASAGVTYPAYFSTTITGNVVDYNNYYNAGSLKLGYRAGADFTTANYLTLNTGGDHSVNMDPKFNTSNRELRLADACAPQGTDLTAFVADDIEGDVRSITPKMGADEYNGKANDLKIDKLISPSLPIALGLQDLLVRVKNVGNTAITSFNITYKNNANAPVTMAWTGLLNQCDTVTLIFTGSDQINLLNSNDLSIYTSLPNGIADNDLSNDSLKVTQLLPLNGTYTIGATGTFPTFADATRALSLGGVSGPVVFNVQAGTYNEKVVLTGPITGASAINRITFDGADASTRIVTSSQNSEATFKVVRASYVSVRNLTVNNTFTGSGTGIALVGSLFDNAGIGFRVKKCVVNLPNAGTANSYGILVTGNSSGFGESNQWTDSVTIDSNTVNGGYNGITVSTSSVLNAAYNHEHKIRWNILNNIYYYGVRFSYIANPGEVSYNTINMDPSNTTNYGIWFNYNQYAGTTGNSKIIGNKINASYYGLYHYYGLNPLTNPCYIYNNMVSVQNYVGIYLVTYATGGIASQVYHNSVNMTGTGASYGIYYYNSGVSSASMFKNNSLRVTGSNTYPIYFSSTVNDSLTNYNNYFNAGGTRLGYRGGEFSTANYRTITKGGDSSFNQDPLFISMTDLHSNNACMKGLDLSADVPTDIDGNIHPAAPSLGAHQTLGLANDIGIDKVFIQGPIKAGAQDITVRIKNLSPNSASSANINYTLNGGTVVTYPWTGTLLGCGDTVSVTFTGAQQATVVSGTNNLTVFTSAPNATVDNNTTNDTANLALSTITKVNGNALVVNGTTGLTATSGIRFDSKPEMLGTTAMTVEAWIKFPNTANDQKIVSKSSIQNGITMGVYQNRFDPEVWTVAGGTGSQRITTSGVSLPNNVVPVNEWTHLAFTFQSGVGIKAYINGSLVGYMNLTTPTSVTPSTTDLYIGTNSWDGIIPATGMIDEVRMWNVVLDSVELRRHMHRTLTGDEAGLVSYIQLNEGISNTNFSDVMSGSTGYRGAGTVIAPSTVPLGGDSAYTVTGTTGTIFTNGALTVNVTELFDNPCDLTILEIPYAPNTVPTAPHIYNNKYWIVQPFGNPGTFASDLTFEFPFGQLNTADASLGLYRRSYNSDGAWTYYRPSTSITPTSVTFMGVDTFGQFTIASNGTSTLPVTLMSFDAKAGKNVVNLNWATANEINSNYFEIERSYDADKFDVIVTVKAAGKSSRVINYTSVDKTANLNKTIYYRLKQVDMDGKYKYSPIAIVEPVSNNKEISVFPNPFSGEVSVAFTSAKADYVNIVIANITGKVVYSTTETVNAGESAMKLNLDNLENGIYFLTLKADGQEKNIKIVKH